MRLISRMFGPRQAAHLPQPAVPPPVPPVELAEREATRSRLEPKWEALDALVMDFRRTDRRLRLRRP